MASVIVVLVMYLYTVCLREEKRRNKIWLSVLIGISAAGVFINSIYGGVLAAAFLALIVIVLYCLKREFRALVNKSLLEHIIIVIVAVLLSATYLLYIMSRPGNNVGGLVIGTLPAYGTLSVIKAVGAILDFYLFVLPLNVGVFILATLALIFIPRLLPDDILVNVLRVYSTLVLF